MAAAHGYIGRSPSDSSTVIARQSFSPTGIQTDFTFAAGYSVGYVDLYLNGARLVEGQDFTATDGSTVGLTTNAVNGDVLEVVAFKAFNATNVSAAGGNFAVSQNLTVTGVSTFTGAITATGGVVGDATGLSGTPDITVRHLKATGISTVSDTTQSTTTTSGALIVSGGVGVAKNLFVGGSMNVAGTLTYEDVTNSETPGITTTGGLVVTGLGATFGSGVGIADSIYHIDDSNTAIRFPAADTFTVETAGSEALRVDSSQRLLVNTNSADSVGGEATHGVYVRSSTNSKVTVVRGSNDAFGGTLRLGSARGTASEVVQDGDELGVIRFCGADGTDINSFGAQITAFVDGSPGSNDLPSRLVFATTADGAASSSERLRIDSSGNLNLVSSTSTLTDLNFTNSSLDVYARVEGGKSGSGVGDLRFHTYSGGLSEQARIDSSGRLIIGHNSSEGSNRKLQVAATDSSAGLEVFRYVTNANSAPSVTLSRSNSGTLGTNTLIGDDFAVGYVQFKAANGSAYNTAAQIVAFVDGAPGVDDMPGRLTFQTTADGASTPTERLRITSAGNVSIQNDSGKFTAGTGDDLQIYHDGTDSHVDNSTGDLILRSTGDDVIIRASDDIHIQTAGSENAIVCSDNGNVALYFNAVNVFQTYNEGIKVIGDEGSSAGIRLEADQGDDNGDTWRINSNQDVNDLTISNDTSGSLVDKLTLTTGGNLTLTGTISDSIGPLRRLGIQGASSSFTLAADHAGKLVRMNSSAQTITLPQNIFTAGDMISIFNVSTGDTTIAQGTGVTLHNSADASTGNRTLAAKGICTIVCSASNEFVISGSNLS